MRAILYAAGRATRLGPSYAETPKVLVSVGGRTLLDWHVEHLAALGVAQITVVSGHRREKIAAAFPDLEARHRVSLREEFNPDYCEGSVISVLVSLPEIEAAGEPVLLMDADVFYHRAVLERLVRSAHPTVLLVDREYSTQDDDPVLVPIRGGRPFEFRKKWTGEAEVIGESVGFFRLNAAVIPRLAASTRGRSSGRSRLDSYDEVIRDLVRAGHFAAEDVTGLPWTEIDFPYDVEDAETRVLPAILRPVTVA